MKLTEPVIFGDAVNGIIDDLSVADSLMPKNSVRLGVNCVFNRPRGAVSQRYGTTVLGSGALASGTVLGIHNHRSSSSSNHQLLGVVGATVYYLNGVTWTQTTTVPTSGLKARFLTYLDNTVILNGTDNPKCWAGTGSWQTSGGALDIANFPIGKFADTLNTRVYTAGVTGALDTVYCSSLESSGTISWTSGNKNFRVYPNDGNGNIITLKSNGKVMLIFKERGLYRYDDNQLDRIVNIGTTSHESVVNDDNGVTYFFGQGANSVGFYMTTGGYPQKISRMIPKYVEAIDPAFYPNIAGFTNGEKIAWSVGSLTIDGITYSNSWLIWNIADRAWEHRNYADSYRVFSQFITSTGAVTVVGGDNDGNVQTIDSGNTDNGTPIEGVCDWGAQTITSRGRVKVINEVIAKADKFQGLSVLIKADEGEYQKIGSLDDYQKKFPVKIRGNRIYFRISSVNSNVPFQFDGFELWDVSDEGTI